MADADIGDQAEARALHDQSGEPSRDETDQKNNK
jgi:hypothetical protein